MIQASKYGQAPTEEEKVELTAEEQQMAETLKVTLFVYPDRSLRDTLAWQTCGPVGDFKKFEKKKERRLPCSSKFLKHQCNFTILLCEFKKGSLVRQN